MKKIDILGIAFGNFKRRKTRSILSVLGVVIGTASIVTMMSLGIAVNIQFQENMKNYGNITEITVYSSWDNQTGKEKPLTEELLEQIRQMEHVKAVTPTINLSGKIFSGKYRNYGSILGIDMSYLEALGLKTDQGRLPTSADVSTSKNIYCVMGASVPYQFEKPVRYTSSSGMIMIGGSSYGVPDGYEVPEGGWANNGQIFDANGNVVGTYPPEIDVMDENTRIRYTPDWNYGEHYPGQELTATRKAPLYTLTPLGVLSRGNNDYYTYVSLEDAIRLQKEAERWQNSQSQGSGSSSRPTETTYNQILVLSDSIENTLEVTESIKQLGYEAYSNADWISQLEEQQSMLQMLLAGIGSVALLVAAIGITNTMVMSIYERTREIGIMKVIGCYLKDIRTMFLTEAGLIGFFGGVFGVLLSYGVSALLNWAASGGSNILGNLGISGGGGSQMSVIPWWLALLGVAFSIAVALVSGFFPARRAMRLSALEAMRT